MLPVQTSLTLTVPPVWWLWGSLPLQPHWPGAAHTTLQADSDTCLVRGPDSGLGSADIHCEHTLTNGSRTLQECGAGRESKLFWETLLGSLHSRGLAVIPVIQPLCNSVPTQASLKQSALLTADSNLYLATD